MSNHHRVVVIGGNGFIGRNLVERLVAAGREVIVGSRSGRSTRIGVPGIRVDVADASSVSDAIARADLVYHLATGGGDRWSDFERDFIAGTRNVAQACLTHSVQRLIYTSSIAALNLGRRGTINEKAGTDRKPERRGMYARAKVHAERVLSDFGREHGLPVVIMRPGVVVGEGGMVNHSGAGYWPCDLRCIGWNRGNNPLPFVLVKDVAQALFAAASAPGIEGLTFNLVGDVRPSAREYVARLACAARRDYHYYPRSPLRLQAIEIGKWLLKVAARKKENSFPSYRDLKSRGLVTQFDCSAAKQLLGWKPNSQAKSFYIEAIAPHVPEFIRGDLRRSPPEIARSQ